MFSAATTTAATTITTQNELLLLYVSSESRTYFALPFFYYVFLTEHGFKDCDEFSNHRRKMLCRPCLVSPSVVAICVWRITKWINTVYKSFSLHSVCFNPFHSAGTLGYYTKFPRSVPSRKAMLLLDASSTWIKEKPHASRLVTPARKESTDVIITCSCWRNFSRGTAVIITGAERVKG